MTEDEQSNNTKKKVPHILVVQDIDNTTAATYDTSFNVEQQQNDKILAWEEGVLQGPF